MIYINCMSSVSIVAITCGKSHGSRMMAVQIAKQSRICSSKDKALFPTTRFRAGKEGLGTRCLRGLALETMVPNLPFSGQGGWESNGFMLSACPGAGKYHANNVWRWRVLGLGVGSHGLDPAGASTAPSKRCTNLAFPDSRSCASAFARKTGVLDANILRAHFLYGRLSVILDMMRPPQLHAFRDTCWMSSIVKNDHT